MWGAAEVQEDEDTHVEVPLDQVLIKLEINVLCLFVSQVACVVYSFPNFFQEHSSIL